MGLEDLRGEYSKLLSNLNGGMVSEVSDDFRGYVKDVINTSLPRGFGLVDNSRVEFVNGRFEVYTGPYQIGSETTEGPLDIEKIVMRGLEDYQVKNPWVLIHRGFVLKSERPIQQQNKESVYIEPQEQVSA